MHLMIRIVSLGLQAIGARLIRDVTYTFVQSTQARSWFFTSNTSRLPFHRDLAARASTFWSVVSMLSNTSLSKKEKKVIGVL